MQIDLYLLILLLAAIASITALLQNYLIKRSMRDNTSKPYDGFICYSSRDEKFVESIQKDLEIYRPPLMFASKRIAPIKAFRDKSDQGITVD